MREQMMHSLVVQTSHKERRQPTSMRKIHGRLNLQSSPVLQLVILVWLWPSHFIINVAGLKDKHEVQRPERIAKGIGEEDTQETEL